MLSQPAHSPRCNDGQHSAAQAAAPGAAVALKRSSPTRRQAGACLLPGGTAWQPEQSTVGAAARTPLAGVRGGGGEPTASFADPPDACPWSPQPWTAMTTNRMPARPVRSGGIRRARSRRSTDDLAESWSLRVREEYGERRVGPIVRCGALDHRRARAERALRRAGAGRDVETGAAGLALVDGVGGLHVDGAASSAIPSLLATSASKALLGEQAVAYPSWWRRKRLPGRRPSPWPTPCIVPPT